MDKETGPLILWSPTQIDTAEQDCAPISRVRANDDCAPVCALAWPAPHPAESTTWRIADGLYRASLPDHHTLLFNPFGPGGVVVLNEAARESLDGFAHPRSLTGPIPAQLAALGLLQPQDGRPAACPAFTADILTAWLHITNACNMRCAYCYLQKTNEAMDRATAQAAVEAVFRSAVHHNFQRVSLKYAGGEPTLNFALIPFLHQRATRLSQQTGLGLREVVLSNGLALTPAMIEFMREADIGLMISLNRIREGDSPLRNIQQAINRGLSPALSITITGQNVDTLTDLVAFALEHKLHFKLNFYRQAGHASSQADLSVDDERLIEAMETVVAFLQKRLPPYSLLNALADRADFSQAHTHPCGVDYNYLVVDHRGRFARCQMAIEETCADITADDPLAVLRSQATGFRNLSVEEKAECRTCPWRYWCAGGCPLLTYHRLGRSDMKSPYCHVYRTLFPQLLRLEGLRLLRHH